MMGAVNADVNTDISFVLENVRRKVDASAVLILGLDGSILEKVGRVEGLEEGVLAALLGHGMAAFYELSHISRGNRGQHVFFSYQDVFYQVVCTSITPDYFLAMIFDLQQVHAPPIGTIWFYLKKACERLFELLQPLEEGEGGAAVVRLWGSL